MNLPWHLYLMSATDIIAAVFNHFRNPKFFLKIIPPYFSNPKLLNYTSGIAEILLGFLLCIPEFSPFASWGIIILLLALFPTNLNMYKNENGYWDYQNGLEYYV